MSKDYPSQDMLDRIANLSILSNPPVGMSSMDEFMKMIKYAWNHDMGKIVHARDPFKLELTTGGWSGNEDIVTAIQSNYMFWGLYWQMSKRGGYHLFSNDGCV